MNAIVELAKRFENAFLAQYGAEVVWNETALSMFGTYDDYALKVEIKPYDVTTLHDDYRSAGLIGSLHFQSRLYAAYQESDKSYRLLFEKFCGETSVGVHIDREGAPRGAMFLGTASGIMLYQSHLTMSDEALMTLVSVFGSVTNDLVEFSKANLTAR